MDLPELCTRITEVNLHPNYSMKCARQMELRGQPRRRTTHNQMAKLQNMLKCICIETGKDWADVAGLAASAYRAARHESTSFTPNKMLFGREAVIPLDLIYGRPIDTPNCHVAYHEWLVDTLLFV